MKAENLRKSILQMAIQGKLVPQDPADEPASVLLERIRAEKQRLIKEGKIKKDKIDSVIFKGDDNRHYEKIGNDPPVCIEDELPFEIPDSWAWTRFSQIVSFELGKTPDRHTNKYWDNGIYPWFSIADMRDKKTILVAKEKISEAALKEKFNSTLVPAGTLIMSFKLTVGRTSLLGVDAVHNEAIISVLPFLPVNNTFRNYLFVTLGLLVEYVEQTDAIKGSTLNSAKIRDMFVPLPPLAEQERIVAEIEKYEPLIVEYDKLEREKSKLDGEIYDKLKKSILQYAIQGKLVPQEPTNEPASVLLEKIRAEKKAKLGKKYVDSFIYKGDDNCYYEKVGGEVKNITDILPFEIPDSWAWARLDNLCDYIHRGKSPVYGTEHILPIIAQKCNQWDGIHVDRCLFAEKRTIENYTSEQFLQPEDIIMNSTGTGTVGRTGLVDQNLFTNFPKFVADSHITVIRPNATCSSKYIYLFLISANIQTDIESKCSGSTNQIELATKTICNFLIPVPPLKEQTRIVERIEVLFPNLKDEA